MIGEWFQRVGSCVPRGFSRYFILEILKDKPHTGKEIIDYATRQSDGIWKPSPGLVYPLLGRLLEENLIEETDDGKYMLTQKGSTTAADVDKIHEIIKTQMDVLFRLGNMGRFVAMDLLERISLMSSMLGSNISNMTVEETQKYKKILETQLQNIESSQGKQIKID